MACTIISTPAVGAADWTDFITQQGLTDRGYSRVSLTNFAGTVASSIGTGAVFECAGSIYQNTTVTAISLATGTASASVAVYIMAIPAAGGTTCTFELDSTAPTWIDAKQGFYASAASVTRAIGGMYIGTAATYFSKFIYTQEMLTSYLLPNAETRPILRKTYDIGEWDMATTANTLIDIAHGLEHDKIIQTFAYIQRDDDSIRLGIRGSDSGDQTKGQCTWLSGPPAVVRVFRNTGGHFQNVAYAGTASTVPNRGVITIEYEA